MANKIHRTVVRNATYKASGFSVRERHNERKNESYMNGDIDKSRANMNIHFHRNFTPSGAAETYEQTFNRLLQEGKIVRRGLREDANVFDELVFDVNTEYFERMGEELGIGGYEYAKSFFAETYQLALKEIGSEEYILSAIFHADEINTALSDEMGKPVYHYHLHVTYIPVVEKEILWSKRTKDKSLVGTVKAVIPQISHSKKWPMRVPVERDGKTVVLNSYSLLQDRFFEHMREAGFENFERGERGSTREHLSDLEYKIQQDKIRLTEKQELLNQQQSELQATQGQITLANTQLQTLHQNIEALAGKVLTRKQIEQIPVKITRPMLGGDDNVTLSSKDWANVKRTALIQAQTDEEYKYTRKEIVALKGEQQALKRDNNSLSDKVKKLEHENKRDFFERSKDKAELHNLKNEVAKIPDSVWNMHTTQQNIKKNTQEIR